jgi:hypothetical protein
MVIMINLRAGVIAGSRTTPPNGTEDSELAEE